MKLSGFGISGKEKLKSEISNSLVLRMAL